MDKHFVSPQMNQPLLHLPQHQAPSGSRVRLVHPTRQKPSGKCDFHRPFPPKFQRVYNRAPVRLAPKQNKKVTLSKSSSEQHIAQQPHKIGGHPTAGLGIFRPVVPSAGNEPPQTPPLCCQNPVNVPQTVPIALTDISTPSHLFSVGETARMGF